MNEPQPLPPPPQLPDPNECCGGGCSPCIFDYYFMLLEEWEERYGLTLREYEKQQAATQIG